jgi:hypothetical protein
VAEGTEYSGCPWRVVAVWCNGWWWSALSRITGQRLDERKNDHSRGRDTWIIKYSLEVHLKFSGKFKIRMLLAESHTPTTNKTHTLQYHEQHTAPLVVTLAI